MSANPPAKQIEQEIANTGVFKTTTVRRPAQIQLCSWFVDWIKQKEYKTADDVQKRTKIGRKMIDRAASNRMTFGLGLNQIGTLCSENSRTQTDHNNPRCLLLVGQSSFA